MKTRIIILVIVMILAAVITGCKTNQVITQKKQYEEIASHIGVKTPEQRFFDLTKGLQVNVITVQPEEEISNNVFHYSGKSLFVSSIVGYVRALGLNEMQANTDLALYVKINRADMELNSSCIEIEVSLLDANGLELFSQKNITSNGASGYSSFNKAYTQALEQINWNRIASFLRTEQLPKDEPQKQVQGLGDTALEQTIIRWDVQSRPQGADVFWRVVSKTPEVKGTNNKYLQTTPYEATKALDIRGLTYQTAGNVRIILRCEKDGYLPQEKEYDVRMVLDQEEISAFFRLVKEE